jgi:small subunit ribosomal protein S20
MPNHKSAEKRDRQNESRKEVNRSNRSRLRTALKNLRTAISAGNKDEAAKLLPSIISIIDRAVHKGILHRNAADRHKSRLTNKVNLLSQAVKAA